MRQLRAITGLTVKAAFRFRLIPVLIFLLVVVVVGLPLVIKHDGTARGLTQVLITYTLGFATTIMGIATLWLACGTLARDIEECQMQVVAVKPVHRWQIWLGKWLGVMVLNLLLLGITGVVVFALVQYRAKKLPAAEQEILRKVVLVGRGSLKPPPIDIDGLVEENVREILKNNKNSSLVVTNDTELRKAISDRLKAQIQVVPSGFVKQWRVDVGSMRNVIRDKPLFMRVKFYTSEPRSTLPNPKTYAAQWQVGPPETPMVQRRMTMLPSESFQEIEIPPNLWDKDGILTVECNNINPNLALFFAIEDGFEILFHESGFGLNFFRGLLIIYMWMGLLAALGLAAASFLKFPVASFASFSVLLIGLASTMLSTAVKEGSIYGLNEAYKKLPVDQLILPAFNAMVKVVSLAQDFSPVESLTTGRSVTWTQIGIAFAQIIVLLSGLLATFGMFCFTHRELASVQSTQ
jgi:hypothetical protein